MSGHVGYHKLLAKIAKTYYLRHMRDEVLLYRRSFPTCQRVKETSRKTKLPMTICSSPIYPFYQISIDLPSIMPVYQGYCWFLTKIDIMSKYFIAVPLHDSSSIEAAETLVNHIITKYSPAKSITSDQGTHFSNKVIQGFARIFKMRT